MTRRAAFRPGTFKQNLLLLAALGSAVALSGCGGGGGGGSVIPGGGTGICSGGSGTVVCGNLYNNSNTAISGVSVQLLDGSGNVVRTSTTNIAGFFKFENVPSTPTYMWAQLSAASYYTSLLTFKGATYQQGQTTTAGKPCEPPVANITANTENSIGTLVATSVSSPPPFPGACW